MAYGISYETPNGNVQIDSDTTNTGLIVISSAASAQSVSFDVTTEMCFAKPSSTTYTQQLVGLRLVNASTNTYNFEDTTGNLVNTEYIIAKWSNELTTSNSGYGLQVFNVDGDLAYDSTLYTGNGGVGIVGYAPQQSLSGAGSSSTSSLVDSDPDLYYNMNQTFATASASQFIGYDFVKDASIGQGIGTYWMAYLVFTGFNGGSQTISIANFTPRFVAEGGSV